MAALYGGVEGNRGEATRTGTKASGIRSFVQTWDVGVTVYLEHDGQALVKARHIPTGRSHVLFEGQLSDLLKEQ